MTDQKVDPTANCLVCLTGNPPLEIKHAVVIEGIPVCHLHAQDVMTILLTGEGDFH